MIPSMNIFTTILKSLGVSEEEVRQALSGPVALSNQKALSIGTVSTPDRPGSNVPGRPMVSSSQVYLLLDTSGSMDEGNKLSQARNGGRRFATDAIKNGYAVGVISFSDDPSCHLRHAQ
jgi:hypothetical protein